MEALEGKKRRISLKWILAAAGAVVLLACFPVAASFRGAANFLTEYVSRPVKGFLGAVFGLLPFSVMELEYILAAVFAVVFLVRTVIKAIRAGDALPVLLRRAGVFLLVVAYMFVYFLWFFAIDYRADSFSDKSGLSPAAVETGDLYAVTRWFVIRASQCAGDVRRDGGGHWDEPMDEYIASSRDIYAGLSLRYPFLSARSRIPKKMYLTSYISSWMGFTGVYFPFSGESNINIDAPGCLIPDTICHELAHQKGVCSEQEANFVGIAACLDSGDPVYVYSGLLSGAIYLSNALYSADPELWYSLTPLMGDELRVDWNDNNAYWKMFEGKVEEVSSRVYDGYLKAQGQELGIRSYGACVDLLVAFYLDEALSAGAAQ